MREVVLFGLKCVVTKGLNLSFFSLKLRRKTALKNFRLVVFLQWPESIFSRKYRYQDGHVNERCDGKMDHLSNWMLQQQILLVRFILLYLWHHESMISLSEVSVLTQKNPEIYSFYFLRLGLWGLRYQYWQHELRAITKSAMQILILITVL